MRQVLLPTAVTRDALTEPGHDVVGGWGATIVSDDAELVDAELVEQCDQLRGDARLSVVSGALVGLPVALKVDGDAVATFPQCLHDVVPLPPRVGNAVQEDDRVGVCWSGLDEVPPHCFAIAWRIHEAVHYGDRSQQFDVAVIVRCWRLNRFQLLGGRGGLRKAVSSWPDVFEATRLVAQACGGLCVGEGYWHDGSP